jgi:hypothetical protein
MEQNGFHLAFLRRFFSEIGLLLVVETNSLESSWFYTLLIRFIKKRKPSFQLLDEFPSVRMRARARFVVALNYLSNDIRRRIILEKFGLLQEGIIMYN